jgi:hypothetical protein
VQGLHPSTHAWFDGAVGQTLGPPVPESLPAPPPPEQAVKSTTQAAAFVRLIANLRCPERTAPEARSELVTGSAGAERLESRDAAENLGKL